MKLHGQKNVIVKKAKKFYKQINKMREDSKQKLKAARMRMEK